MMCRISNVIYFSFEVFDSNELQNALMATFEKLTEEMRAKAVDFEQYPHFDWIKTKLTTGKYSDPWQYIDDVECMFQHTWSINKNKQTKIHRCCTEVSVKLGIHWVKTICVRLFLSCSVVSDFQSNNWSRHAIAWLLLWSEVQVHCTATRMQWQAMASTVFHSEERKVSQLLKVRLDYWPNFAMCLKRQLILNLFQFSIGTIRQLRTHCVGNASKVLPVIQLRWTPLKLGNRHSRNWRTIMMSQNHLLNALTAAVSSIKFVYCISMQFGRAASCVKIVYKRMANAQ